jgi:MFS family permease
VLVYLPVRDPPRPPKRPSLGDTGALVTRRDVLLPAALNAVIQYISFATTFGFMPILARQLGASQVALGLLVSLNIGVITIGNLFTASLLRRLSARNLVYAGFAVSALGIALAGGAGSLPAVFASQIIIGLGNGICYPILMGLSIERVEEERRSTAMGLHQAVYAIGMFAGPWLSGLLAVRIGLQPMFIATAVATLVAGVGLTSLLRSGRAG